MDSYWILITIIKYEAFFDLWDFLSFYLPSCRAAPFNYSPIIMQLSYSLTVTPKEGYVGIRPKSVAGVSWFECNALEYCREYWYSRPQYCPVFHVTMKYGFMKSSPSPKLLYSFFKNCSHNGFFSTQTSICYLLPQLRYSWTEVSI